MDSTGANLTGIIAVNKQLQIWQLRCDPEATSYQENVLTVVHGDTLPVRSTEQHQVVRGVSIRCMKQEFSSQTSARLDEEIQMILRLLCPRDHHEWVTLQEGPEADGRYPEVNVLPSFDVKWLLTLYAEPDRTIFVRDVGSRTAISEEAILVDDNTALDGAHEQKHSS